MFSFSLSMGLSQGHCGLWTLGLLLWLTFFHSLTVFKPSFLQFSNLSMTSALPNWQGFQPLLQAFPINFQSSGIASFFFSLS
jgi:hypothetical protein